MDILIVTKVWFAANLKMSILDDNQKTVKNTALLPRFPEGLAHSFFLLLQRLEL